MHRGKAMAGNTIEAAADDHQVVYSLQTCAGVAISI
jgi:hypothetical protein